MQTFCQNQKGFTLYTETFYANLKLKSQKVIRKHPVLCQQIDIVDGIMLCAVPKKYLERIILTSFSKNMF